MRANAEECVVAGFDGGDGGGAADGGAVGLDGGGGEGVRDEDDETEADGGDVLS